MKSDVGVWEEEEKGSKWRRVVVGRERKEVNFMRTEVEVTA